MLRPMRFRGAEGGGAYLRWRRETLATRERAFLGRLIEFLTGFGAPIGDTKLPRRTLAGPFLLVVGGFNVGKLAFINAPINEDITAEGSLPTTTA